MLSEGFIGLFLLLLVAGGQPVNMCAERPARMIIKGGLHICELMKGVWRSLLI